MYTAELHGLMHGMLHDDGPIAFEFCSFTVKLCLRFMSEETIEARRPVVVVVSSNANGLLRLIDCV